VSAGERGPAAVPRGSAGLHLAVALAGLLIVAGLVLRASVGLSTPPPQLDAQPVRHLVTQPDELDLAADDAAPVFDDVLLGPGAQAVSCRTLVLHATSEPTPIELGLAAYRGSDALAAALHVRVEEEAPTAAPAAGCEGFVPARTVAEGPLATLGQAGGTAPGGWRAAAGTQSLRYRLTVLLPADSTDALQGTSVHDLTFRWATTSAGRPPTWSDRTVKLAMAVAQNSVVPLLLMTAVAILFIGIQDRLDRNEPKLALASVQADQPLAFTPTAVRAAERRAPRASATWTYAAEHRS
jgi:hypothetical protein